MRLLYVLLTALALSACDSPSTPASPLGAAAGDLGFLVSPEPAPVPPVEFVDAAGKPTTLERYRGKVVLLNLWATWCAPCREEMPTLDTLQARLGGKDFEVIALSLDQTGLPAVQNFYREIGIGNLDIYVDREARAADRLAALGLPTTLLLDRQGREVARLIGVADWDSPQMQALLADFVAATGEARNRG